ncbi:MAG: VOC family protein [Nevskia sp.]|nr:VOC family protein [Nevskia sp.]
MIAYTTLGTNDMARAGAFYDKLLAELGAKRVMDFDRIVLWGNAPKSPMFAVCKPFDGKPATVGNGVMISLGVDSRAKVDAIYRKAIELGAKDEGAPGERGPGFYLAYFRDLDGNKLALFTS